MVKLENAIVILVMLFVGVDLGVAHDIPGDDLELDDRLEQCGIQIFRAKRADTGLHLAAVSAEKLVEQLYPHVLSEALRGFGQGLPGVRGDARDRLAAPAVGIALQLRYQGLVPRSLKREGRLRSLWALLLEEIDDENLMSIVGSRTASYKGQPVDTRMLGALVLAAAVLDLYDKVSWGPEWLLSGKVLETYGASGWSLEGQLLTPDQFEGLRSDALAALAGASEATKVELVGGPCLHAHPLQSIAAPIADDPAEGKTPRQRFLELLGLDWLPGWFFGSHDSIDVEDELPQAAGGSGGDAAAYNDDIAPIPHGWGPTNTNTEGGNPRFAACALECWIEYFDGVEAGNFQCDSVKRWSEGVLSSYRAGVPGSAFKLQKVYLGPAFAACKSAVSPILSVRGAQCETRCQTG